MPTAFRVPLLFPVTDTFCAVTLPLAAPDAVFAPREEVGFSVVRLKSVPIFLVWASSAATFLAVARAFSALILFCSSTLFFLNPSVSVSVTVVEAPEPVSPIMAMLFTSSRFTATPAPTVALVRALPRARPPTTLVIVVLLSAPMEKVPAALTVVSSSNSTSVLFPPVSRFREPDTLRFLSALPALRMMPVWIISFLAFRAMFPLSFPAVFAASDTFFPDRIRLSPIKSCTATVAPAALPLLSDMAKNSPP